MVIFSVSVYNESNYGSIGWVMSDELSQDPLEKFWGMQRQRGGTNENPNISQAIKNPQVRVIDTSCRHVMVKGNIRGNDSKEQDEDFNKPLQNRKRHFK